MERANRAHEDLRGALVRTVRGRAEGLTQAPPPEADTVSRLPAREKSRAVEATAESPLSDFSIRKPRNREVDRVASGEIEKASDALRIPEIGMAGVQRDEARRPRHVARWDSR